MTLEHQAVLLAALGISLIILLERRFPYDRQSFLRKGFLTDLVFYTVLQSLVLGYLTGRLIGFVDGWGGFSRMRLLAGWSIPAQVGLFVVTHDLYIYLFHRWEHSSPWLWRLHEIHHAAKEVDWIASLRGHAVEMFVNGVVEFAPMILLGAAPEVPVVKAAIGAVWGVWIHSNVNAHTGVLQWLINGPEAHRWHHATDADAFNRNFATKFAIWDRLFRTAFLPRGRKPASYGLPDLSFPASYLGQQAFAFRRMVA